METYSSKVQLKMTLREAVVLRDVLQAYEPLWDFEPVSEQEHLRVCLEKLGGGLPYARSDGTFKDVEKDV